MEKVDARGQTFWLYFDEPSYSDRVRVPTYLPSRASTRDDLPDVEALHGVYAALLEECGLTVSHRQHLRGRGLEDAVITRNGYSSMPHARVRSSIVDRMERGFPRELLGRVPGFFSVEGTLRLGGSPGILIPTRNVGGKIVALVIRADDATQGGKYQMLSSRRKGGTSPGAPAHVPLFDGETDAVAVTEGVLKADVATALGGRLVLGCPGLAWRTVLPAVRALKTRSVNIAFDMDAAENEHVRRARDEAAQEFLRLGYETAGLSWDPSCKGIDDALQGDVEIGRQLFERQAPELGAPAGIATPAPVEAMPTGDVFSLEPVLSAPVKRAKRCETLVLAIMRGDGSIARPRMDCETWFCGDCAKNKVRAVLEQLQLCLAPAGEYYCGSVIADKHANARILQSIARARSMGQRVEYLRVRQEYFSDDFFFARVLYLATSDLGGGWTRVDRAGAYHYARTQMLVLPGVRGVRLSAGWRLPKADEHRDKWGGFIGLITQGRFDGAMSKVAAEVRKEAGVQLDPDMPIGNVHIRTTVLSRLRRITRDPHEASVDDEINAVSV